MTFQATKLAVQHVIVLSFCQDQGTTVYILGLQLLTEPDSGELILLPALYSFLCTFVQLAVRKIMQLFLWILQSSCKSTVRRIAQIYKINLCY